MLPMFMTFTAFYLLISTSSSEPPAPFRSYIVVAQPHSGKEEFLDLLASTYKCSRLNSTGLEANIDVLKMAIGASVDGLDAEGMVVSRGSEPCVTFSIQPELSVANRVDDLRFDLGERVSTRFILLIRRNIRAQALDASAVGPSNLISEDSLRKTVENLCVGRRRMLLRDYDAIVTTEVRRLNASFYLVTLFADHNKFFSCFIVPSSHIILSGLGNRGSGLGSA